VQLLQEQCSFRPPSRMCALPFLCLQPLRLLLPRLHLVKLRLEHCVLFQFTLRRQGTQHGVDVAGTRARPCRRQALHSIEVLLSPHQLAGCHP
jgi:hypothetical protein